MTALPLLLDSSRLAGRFIKGLRPTGIDRVCLAYQGRYGARARAVVGWRGRQVVASRAASQRLFGLLGQRLPGGRSGTPLSRLAALTQAWAAGTPRALQPAAALDAPARLLLNLGHSGLEHPGYGHWLQGRGLRPVFMLHDLIPITHPEFAVPGGRARHERRLHTMLRTGAGLVLNSEDTRRHLQAWADAQHLPMPPCVVAPLGVDVAAPAPGLPAPALHAPYFVMLGTIEARKGHWFMLQLWRQLVQALGAAVPRLVIIGRRGWEAESAIDMLDRCDALRGVVHEVRDCSDAELAGWLQGAHGLVFPSLAEGFGLPLAEALALGTPVIASHLPVFMETAPANSGLATYLDPLDGPAWAQAIQAQARLGPEALAAQRAGIARRFSAPRWEHHFAIVDAFLEAL